jgi:hypothetical protein
VADWQHKMKTDKKIRNPYVIPAKSRKAGKHKDKKSRRKNGKNKQTELLKEAEE